MRAGLAGGGARTEALIPSRLETDPSTARKHFFLKKGGAGQAGSENF
jgi:hypothetical protein